MRSDPNRVLDEYLICAAKAGGRDAWGRLVSRWQPKLVAHAWRLLGNSERAKDAVQDAWVQILRGLWRLDDAAAFPAWAYRIVTRRCQRAFASSDLQGPPTDAPTEDLAPSAVSGEHAVELAQVMQAMRTLPAAQRSALALFYLEDMSVAEVAVALDVPPGTVKTRLMHARLKLRARLEGSRNGQDG